MKKIILIQARSSSRRLPKKMLDRIGSFTLLECVYLRCKESKVADDVFIITSKDDSDNQLVEKCKEKNMNVYRGDLNNVLQRFIDASNFLNLNDTSLICRVCGDSPFVDISAIDKMFLELIKNESIDYIKPSNALNGFLSEVFKVKVLNKLLKFNLSIEHKEHVTLFINQNKDKFNTTKLCMDLKPELLKDYTLTVDYKEDLELIKIIYNKLNKFSFTSKDIINILYTLKGLK